MLTLFVRCGIIGIDIHTVSVRHFASGYGNEGFAGIFDFFEG